MNDYDDEWMVDNVGLTASGKGLKRYPILRGLIWFFRGAAIVIAIGSFLVSLEMLDQGLGFFLSTFGMGLSIAGGQLFLAEVISVVVDIADNTRESSKQLHAVQSNVDWLRTKLGRLMQQGDDVS